MDVFSMQNIPRRKRAGDLKLLRKYNDWEIYRWAEFQYFNENLIIGQKSSKPRTTQAEKVVRMKSFRSLLVLSATAT